MILFFFFLSFFFFFLHFFFPFSKACTRYSRVCYTEAIKYAKKRKVFGVSIWNGSQVVRKTIAMMVQKIQACEAVLERLTYAVNEGVDGGKIAGSIALAKVQANQCFEWCVRESSQIFGGNSYLRQGVGETVERLYREVRVQAIGGGSESVMQDLAARRIRITPKL